MIDNKTQRLSLPLPNVDNYLEDDVVRLSEALEILDAKVATVGDDGKIPMSQIPAVALTDTFPVNSEAAMLALDAQPGDVAIRNDLSKSFILMAAPATTLGNWKEIVNDALLQLAKPNADRLIGSSNGGSIFTDYATSAFKKHSEFGSGETVTSSSQAVKNSTNGFWYVSKSNAFPVAIPASPDSNWLCVGLLTGYDLNDIRNFMNGSDDNVALETALASRDTVVIPEDVSLTIRPVVLNRKGELVLNGSLIASPSINSNAVLLSGSGLAGFKISGTGVIDGNEANVTASKLGLIYFDNSDNISVQGITLKNNFIEEANVQPTDGTLVISGGARHKIRNVNLENWSLEGILIIQGKRCSVDSIVATSTFSLGSGTRCKNYSAVQVSGSKNRIRGVQTYNTGASAVGCDSRESVIADLVIEKVRYGNGLNLGHVGSPADNTVVSNVTVDGIEDPTNTGSAGVSSSNGTKNVCVTNLTVRNSTQNAINVTNGGTGLRVTNLHAENCARVSTQYGGYLTLENVTTDNCTVGINKQQATDKINLINVDLSGCTTKVSGSEAGFSGSNVTFDSTQERVFAVQISNTTLPLTVSNPNIRPWSVLSFSPTNKNAASALPCITYQSSGFLTIDAVNSPTHYAGLRIEIA